MTNNSNITSSCWFSTSSSSIIEEYATDLNDYIITPIHNISEHEYGKFYELWVASRQARAIGDTIPPSRSYELVLAVFSHSQLLILQVQCSLLYLLFTRHVTFLKAILSISNWTLELHLDMIWSWRLLISRYLIINNEFYMKALKHADDSCRMGGFPSLRA